MRPGACLILPRNREARRAFCHYPAPDSSASVSSMPSLYAQYLEAAKWSDICETLLGAHHKMSVQAAAHRDGLLAELVEERAA